MVEFGRDRKAKSGATSAIERELEEQAYHMAARLWPDAHIIQDSLINHPTIQGDYFLINPPFSMQLEQKNIPLENAIKNASKYVHQVSPLQSQECFCSYYYET